MAGALRRQLRHRLSAQSARRLGADPRPAHDVAPERVRALVAFVRLARPIFLGGGFIGFALGAAVARYDGYALSAGAYALGQAQVTAFQLMVHFANDYFDRAGDGLAQRTLFSGGSGVLTNGELAPR